MSGIIHPYYMVALAPAIAALVSVGVMALWERRLGWFGRIVAAAGVALTAWWAQALLDRSPSWFPWLRWVVILAGLAAVGSILAAPWLRSAADRLSGQGRLSGRGRLALAAIPLLCALVAGLTGPAAYAIDTVATTHSGSIPSAGPQTARAFGGGAPGGAGGAAGPGGTRGGTSQAGGTAGARGARRYRWHARARRRCRGGNGGRLSWHRRYGIPSGTRPSGTSTGAGASTGTSAGAGTKTGPGGSAGRTGGAGGPGGLSGNTQVSSALVTLLEKGASGYTWVAATEGSQEAAPLELATGGEAVMAIGGFNGTDPAPSLAEFKTLVAEHKIHYYIGTNSESFGGGRGSSSIASWVASHFTKETVGGTTVYNLSEAVSS